MNKKIAVQMDPIENLNLSGDSTFSILLEAQTRNYNIFFYTPKNLSMRKNILFAKGHYIKIHQKPVDSIIPGKQESVRLDEFDAILMRQDPPFDMSYITATHLLETIIKKTVIVNNPISVRNNPEKIFAHKYSKYMPPTLITRDMDEIIKFKNEYEDIIIKPLYGNGGDGIFYLKKNDKNLESLIEMFQSINKEQFIVQKYLPSVVAGDKRIILIDGKIAGAINRIPKKGEIRSNMHVGGTATKTIITKKEKEICEAMEADLKRLGLMFVGIDVIDGFLTEINVTSTTGIREIQRFDNINVASTLWDSIESYL